MNLCAKFPQTLLRHHAHENGTHGQADEVKRKRTSQLLLLVQTHDVSPPCFSHLWILSKRKACWKLHPYKVTQLKIFTLPIILFLAQLQYFTLLLFSTWLHKQSSWTLSASLKSTLIVALNSFFSGHDFPRRSRDKMVPSKGLDDWGVDRKVKKQNHL